jgi:hypothetical protein
VLKVYYVGNLDSKQGSFTSEKPPVSAGVLKVYYVGNLDSKQGSFTSELTPLSTSRVSKYLYILTKSQAWRCAAFLTEMKRTRRVSNGVAVE